MMFWKNVIDTAFSNNMTLTQFWWGSYHSVYLTDFLCILCQNQLKQKALVFWVNSCVFVCARSLKLGTCESSLGVNGTMLKKCLAFSVLREKLFGKC